MEASDRIEQLLDIMAQLRDPESGCLWDRQQNFQSIVPHTIEEAYEVADAVRRNNRQDLCEELGDLLLQVVYYARMAEEEGSFRFADVVRAINAKLMRRHPHIFGSAAAKANAAKTDAAAKQQWEAIKAQEKAAKGQKEEHYLDSVLSVLPAAREAAKLQEKAEKVGFDWAEPLPVVQKTREELDELQQALEKGDADEQMAEYGDVLFTLINLGRKIGADFENALSLTNQKFRNRFNYIEQSLKQRGSSLESASLAEMEALWQEAKNRGAAAGQRKA